MTTVRGEQPAAREAEIETWYAAFLSCLSADDAGASSDYCLKPGYSSRSAPGYFHDDVPGIVHQPDVYELAALMARRVDARCLIDIGCGRGDKLVAAAPDLLSIGIDFGANVEACRARYPDRRWIAYDLDRPHALPVGRHDLEGTVIVCSDVIEHLVHPEHLLESLRIALREARLLVLSTPERDLARGIRDSGPPGNPCHVREWSIAEFARLLERYGLGPLRIGLTRSDDRSDGTRTILAIVAGERYRDALRPGRSCGIVRRMLGRLTGGRHGWRGGFRDVVAVMTAYNEGDIIAHSIRKLVDQGIGVYLIDNWSTDATLDQAKLFLGRGLIGFERFPASGPARYYEWERLLRRVEELHGELRARWCIHHDADEVRESPWPGVSLYEGIRRVDREGYTCINHVVLVFRPVDDAFVPGTDMEARFRYYEPGRRPGHAVQMKAWRNLGRPVDLAASGGHSVEFEGKRVYPVPFLLKHYPIRSQAHGLRKVLAERRARFRPEERAMGWHGQYDGISEAHSFIVDPSGLKLYDEVSFKTALLARSPVPSR